MRRMAPLSVGRPAGGPHDPRAAIGGDKSVSVPNGKGVEVIEDTIAGQLPPSPEHEGQAQGPGKQRHERQRAHSSGHALSRRATQPCAPLERSAQTAAVDYQSTPHDEEHYFTQRPLLPPSRATLYVPFPTPRSAAGPHRAC